MPPTKNRRRRHTTALPRGGVQAKSTPRQQYRRLQYHRLLAPAPAGYRRRRTGRTYRPGLPTRCASRTEVAAQSAHAATAAATVAAPEEPLSPTVHLRQPVLLLLRTDPRVLTGFLSSRRSRRQRRGGEVAQSRRQRRHLQHHPLGQPLPVTAINRLAPRLRSYQQPRRFPLSRQHPQRLLKQQHWHLPRPYPCPHSHPPPPRSRRRWRSQRRRQRL